jgi:hypothetical protein
MTSETFTRYRFPGTDGAWWLGLRPLPLIWLAAVVTVTVLDLYLGASLLLGIASLTVGPPAPAPPAPTGGATASSCAPPHRTQRRRACPRGSAASASWTSTVSLSWTTVDAGSRSG